MLQSELKILQEFGDSLDPKNVHRLEQAVDRDQFLEKIKAECGRVREAITNAVFTPAKDTLIERYIQYHQTGIITLADQLHSFTGSDQAKQPDTVRKTFISELFSLLNYIERFFSRYFNPDSKIPESYRTLALHELSTPIADIAGSIETRLQSTSLKSCLLDYLVSFSKEKFPSEVNFRDLIYLKSFLNELEQVFQQKELKDLDTKVSAILIYHNFNHLGFFACCQENIRNEIDSAESKEQCLHILSRSLIFVKNQQSKPGFSYHPGWPGIKSMLESWLGDEISTAQLTAKNENYAAANQQNVPVGKLMMNLSVAQIACLIKMFYEEGCYGTSSITDILKFTVKHYQSKRQQQISYGSLSKEYYSISQVTAAVAKDLLLRMAARIAKTYFPVVAAMYAAYYWS